MSGTGPLRLPAERVTVDGDWRPAMQYFERDGVTPKDLSAATADAWCEVRPIDGGTTTTRKKSVPGDTVYVDDGTGDDGKIEFIFLLAAIALFSGAYNVDYWYVEAGSSVKRKVAEQIVYFDPART